MISYTAYFKPYDGNILIQSVLTVILQDEVLMNNSDIHVLMTFFLFSSNNSFLEFLYLPIYAEVKLCVVLHDMHWVQKRFLRIDDEGRNTT